MARHGAGGGVHETEVTELVAKSDTDELFNPITQPFDTTGLDDVRIGVWLNTKDVTAKSGVQFSNNGVEWDAAVAIGSYSSTAGWVIPTVYTSLSGLMSAYFLYVRFGLFVKNATASTTYTGSGQARLSIETPPSAGRTVVCGPIKVNTKGSTTGIFHPMTGPLQTSDFIEVRPTVRLEAASGLDGSGNSLIQLQPAYQVSDTPDDFGDWTSPTTFASNMTLEGTKFMPFASLSLTKRYVRFGVIAKNDSDSTAIEACFATMRLDLRN